MTGRHLNRFRGVTAVFLLATALAVVTLTIAATAHARATPNRPVTLIDALRRGGPTGAENLRLAPHIAAFDVVEAGAISIVDHTGDGNQHRRQSRRRSIGSAPWQPFGSEVTLSVSAFGVTHTARLVLADDLFAPGAVARVYRNGTLVEKLLPPRHTYRGVTSEVGTFPKGRKGGGVNGWWCG